MSFPVGIISYKPGYPKAAGEPHQPGLKNYQQDGIKADPVKETVIIKRHANVKKPYEETDYT